MATGPWTAVVRLPALMVAVTVMLAIWLVAPMSTALADTIPPAPLPEPEDPPAPPPAMVEPEPDLAAMEQGPFVPVTRFELRYLREHPDLPWIESLEEIEVRLGRTEDDRYVVPGSAEAVRAVTRPLSEFAADEPRLYSVQAVQHILETLRDALPWRGVHVAPAPQDLAPDGTDLRPADRLEVRIIVTVGRITDLRTQARGERIATGRLNHPLHQRVRDRSPLQPADPERDVPGDLIDPDALEAYAFRLSRHPGRRVDTTLAAAEELAGTTLDYIVTENRPYTVYAHLANTGTQQTRRWRQSFGLIHNQFTGHDDILSLEYATASFDRTHAVRAAYEAPVYGTDRLRVGGQVSWSDYTARDVAIPDDRFSGTNINYRGQLIANVFQRRNLFVDAFAGARVLDARVESTISIFHGRERFLLPLVGVELEHRSEWYRNVDRIELEWHVPGAFNAGAADMAGLGRGAVDRYWATLSWDLMHAVYLEPLLWRDAWRDPSTPESSTLAHELSARFRGQHAFGKRLIPQAQRVAGGMHTVRGYREAAVAGDTVLIGTLEYRLRVPRLFPIEPEPRELFGKPFRFAPQYVYGHADWDVAPRVFLDAARVIINDVNGADVDDETLLGAGLGVEVAYRRNLRMQLDWGVALQTLENEQGESGDSRLHFALTVLY